MLTDYERSARLRREGIATALMSVARRFRRRRPVAEILSAAGMGIIVAGVAQAQSCCPTTGCWGGTCNYTGTTVHSYSQVDGCQQTCCAVEYWQCSACAPGSYGFLRDAVAVCKCNGSC